MNEDEQAVVFRQWFGQYTALMARLARAYTATPEDCEDLLQEILFAVWRSIPRFEHKASPSTWIYRVALNTALAWQRKGRHQRRFRPLLETADAPQDNRDRFTIRRESIVFMWPFGNCPRQTPPWCCFIWRT